MHNERPVRHRPAAVNFRSSGRVLFLVTSCDFPVILILILRFDLSSIMTCSEATFPSQQPDDRTLPIRICSQPPMAIHTT